MKKIIITLTIVFFIAFACKKEKGQKCYWEIIINNQPRYSWLDKPSADQINKIKDTCSCAVSVNEKCFPCDLQVTDQGGIDIPCR